MRILLVEDDAGKAVRIAETLCAVAGVAAADIERVCDGVSARRALAARSYDLMVLDVVLPPRIDLTPTPDGGMKILEELEVRGRLRMPSHIVGLTAYPEILVSARDRFSSRLLTLLRYDETTNDWAHALTAIVNQIHAAIHDRLTEAPSHESELAIVCALHAPELRAVLRNGWTWSQHHCPGDYTLYHRAEITSGGKSFIAYSAAAPDMGMAAAAVLATKMIYAFRPRLLAMVGIAAGIRGEANWGDVLVADPSWDWGSGKMVVDGDDSKLLAAPRQYRLHASLRNELAAIRADTLLLSAIQDQWDGPTPETRLSLHIGPVASGASVLADGLTVRAIQAQQRKVIGIEMEAYSIFAAAEEAPDPQPLPVVLKSVVDFADKDKDDRFQGYAAYTSAMVLRTLIERLS